MIQAGLEPGTEVAHSLFYVATVGTGSACTRRGAPYQDPHSRGSRAGSPTARGRAQRRADIATAPRAPRSPARLLIPTPSTGASQPSFAPARLRLRAAAALRRGVGRKLTVKMHTSVCLQELSVKWPVGHGRCLGSDTKKWLRHWDLCVFSVLSGELMLPRAAYA